MDIRIIDGQWLVLATAAATNTTSRHLPAPSLLAAIFSQSLSLMSLSRNNIAVRRLSYNNKSSFATNVNVRSAAASTTSRCGHNFSSVSNNNSNNSIISPVIRWGILSTGRIASDFVKAMSLVENAEAVAVAARTSTSASTFASLHSIPTHHSSYQELISNPNIDIIYIATIADHHYTYAKASILAGKHTLIEKPMTLSHSQTLELITLAQSKHVFLMEGMWTRCFPALHKLRELIASNEIGPIVYVQGDFGYAFPSEYSGGITYDVGMYIAQFGRIAFPKSKIKHVQAVGTMKNGVDYTVMTTVTYDRLLQCENSNGGEHGADDICSNDSSSNEGSTVGMLQMALTGASNTEERCILQGTLGRIILDGPFHVPQRLRVVYNDGRRRGVSDNSIGSSSNSSRSRCTDSNSSEVVYDFPLPNDPYQGEWNNPGSIGLVYQINEVGDALRMGKMECDSFTWQDSLDVAQIIDEIVRQVRGK